MFIKLKNIIFILAISLSLQACTTLGNLFGDNEEPALEGERITILQLQKELEADPILSGVDIILPDAWENQYWPQSGGYPNHVMGNLALGSDLKKIWSVSTGAGSTKRHPLITSPVVAEEMLFTLDAAGVLSAFDANDGKKKWKLKLVPKDFDKKDAIGGGMAFSGGKLYVSAGFKEMHAINPFEGSIIWTKGLTAPIRSAPTVMGDQVYVVSIDNRLTVLATDDGSQLWDYVGLEEVTGLLGSSSPAVDRNLAVATFSSGEVVAFRTENGQMLWSDNLSSIGASPVLTNIGDVKALPVIDGGVVFANSFGGRLVAIDERTGDRLWQREFGGSETPLSVGDTLFLITSDQQLVALHRDSGNIRWVLKLRRYLDEKNFKKQIIWNGPILAGGRLILTSNRAKMIEVSINDGAILKETKISGNTVVAPIVANSTLYIPTNNGKVAAYR